VRERREVMGVNDKIQLAQSRLCTGANGGRVMLAGATLADPPRIDIRGDVKSGATCSSMSMRFLIGSVQWQGC